jgi:NAD(P)H-dependent FMN reductase
MYKLKVINSTVRPGRKSPIIANWITAFVNEQGNFEAEFLDLGVINLPMMNEAYHPVLKKYEHEHTKQWSAKIEEADALIFVTAEYDYNYPAPLRNALEYLYHEWAYKAAGIVSYGGLSAGTRAANSLKADLSTFKTVPLPTAVHIPFFDQFINEQEEFIPNETIKKSAEVMLKELARWTKGLKIIKEDQ